MAIARSTGHAAGHPQGVDKSEQATRAGQPQGVALLYTMRSCRLWSRVSRRATPCGWPVAAQASRKGWTSPSNPPAAGQPQGVALLYAIWFTRLVERSYIVGPPLAAGLSA